MPRKSRSEHTGHHGGTTQPRHASQPPKTPRDASRPKTPRDASQTPSHAKKKQASGNKKHSAQQPQHLTPEMMEQIKRLVRENRDNVNPVQPIPKDIIGNPVNDTPYKKEDQLKKAASRTWSNYPIPLPPQLDAQSVYGVRSALLNANDRELMNYYSLDKDGVLGIEYELGVLECYDGITEFNEGNFLSCDFVNPKYVDQMTKLAGLNPTLAAIQPPQDLPSVWLKNRSCFVYAPPETILSTVEASRRKTIPKTEAVENWKRYASTEVETTASRKSPTVVSKKLLSQFWFYHEEFVEFENRDLNKKGLPLKEKGRIGMLFPIKPIVVDADNILSIFTVPDDSIGWGRVGQIGGPLPQLASNENIASWNELQKKIGKYILLTSLWSSSTSDAYEVFVEPKVLKDIYNRVYEMTKGNMIVNVRRGADAYGRLCVVQKQIVLDPKEASFGIVGEAEQAKPKINVYVTQIFTCVKPISAYDSAWQRQKITAAYTKHNSMSEEEKNVSNMFQMNNNKIIQCLKNEQYRDVMQAFWKDDTNNMSALLKVTGENKWCMNSIKAMLIGMLLTTYKVMFQRLPTKAACHERTERFMNIMKNYRIWFSDSKCFANDEFLQQYEKDMKEKELKADQFTGMPPSLYTPNDGYSPTDGEWDKDKEPEIIYDEDANDTLKIPSKSGVHDSVNIDRLVQEGVQTELEKRGQVQQAQKQRAYDEEIQRIRDDEGESPKGPDAEQLKKKFGVAAHFGAEESFSDRLAKLQNW